MKITSVEKSKRNKNRLTVYIDEHYSFTISEGDYLTLNLYENKEITHEEIEYIKNNINYRTAKFTAIKHLSLKLRSEKEVYVKLETEGYDIEIIEKVIDELKSMGYINDKLYAQKFIYDRSKLKPQAKKLLKYELQNKGISENSIDEALDGWEVDEVVVAEGLMKKRFGKYDMKDEKVIKKIHSFLQHRGYGYELINEIINKFN